MNEEHENTVDIADVGSDAPSDESLEERTWSAFDAEETTRRRGSWLWLVITIALFAYLYGGDSDGAALGGLYQLSIIIVVLLVHEAGHFVGMIAFGYRDVRMFFIPFFGAAVSGRKHSVPTWQEAIVLLLGPIPGLVAGVGLYLALRPAQDTLLFVTASTLVWLNVFNLLPLVPLDGGRLLEVLLFSRRPVLLGAFLSFATLGFGALAWAFDSWVFGILAALVLVAIPFRVRQVRHAIRLRHRFPAMPTDEHDLDREQRGELFRSVREINPYQNDPKTLAESIRGLHGKVVARRAGGFVSALFLVVYLSGWILGLGFVAITMRTP